MSPRKRLYFGGLLSTFVSCTYAWPTGTAPLDASPDAPTDASVADRLIGDAAADADADARPPPDAPPDSATNCGALKAAVEATRGPAKQCPNIGVGCFAKLLDDCDCEGWSLDGSTKAAKDFANAVAAYKASSCTISCPAGTCRPKVTNGACIIVDGGAAQECSP